MAIVNHDFDGDDGDGAVATGKADLNRGGNFFNGTPLNCSQRVMASLPCDGDIGDNDNGDDSDNDDRCPGKFVHQLTCMSLCDCTRVQI